MSLPQQSSEAPHYRPETEQLLARISGARFRSQLGARQLMMEASRVRPRLPGEDIEAIEVARVRRWGELSISREAELGLDIPELPEQTLAEEPWSPTQGMTDEGVTREPDFAERAANDRDK